MRRLTPIAIGLSVLLATGTAHAQSIAGAEIAPEDGWVIEGNFGFDWTRTFLYNFGFYGTPVKRLQLGLDVGSTVVTNSLGLSAKLNVFRSENDRFLLSAQGAARGLYLWAFLTSEAALTLEPALLAEWRVDEAKRWSIFGEVGSFSTYGVNYDRFYDGGSGDDSDWSHGARIAAGFSWTWGSGWALSTRGGITGSLREPLPLITFGISKAFRSSGTGRAVGH